METINHESYVSLEVAKLLKEAGFDWKCINRYIKDTDVLVPCLGKANWNATEWGIINDYKSAPTLAVTQRWLREVKGFEIEVQRYESPHPVARELFETLYDKVVKRKFAYSVNVLDENDESLYDEQDFYTYESALEAGIKKALEIILEKRE